MTHEAERIERPKMEVQFLVTVQWSPRPGHTEVITQIDGLTMELPITRAEVYRRIVHEVEDVYRITRGTCSVLAIDYGIKHIATGEDL